MVPGRHLHAVAWAAAALLWGVAATRALDRPSGRPPGRGRRVTLCLATVAAVVLGARLHFLLPGGMDLGEGLPEGLGGKLAEVARRAWDVGAGAHATPGLRIGGGLVAAVGLLATAGPRWLGGAISRCGLLDAVGPPAGIAIALGRLGCLAEGCCFGTPCEWAWCIRSPQASPAWWSQVALGRIADHAAEALPVHPYPVYLAAAALLAAGLARVASRVLRFEGAAAAAFAAALSATRLSLEPLRESAFGQGASAQSTLDVVTLAGALLLLACLAYRGEGAASRSPTRQASSPSPGMPTPCTRRPPSGSSKAGSRPKRRHARQASADDRTRTG